MKRIFLFALLIFAALGLTATAVNAETMAPGCNPLIWGYLQDQADATRARNRGYERDILNRQPSTLYLTCFDQAMAMSARLGMIFSDNINPAPPPANTVVFTAPLAYSDWGASQPTLAMDLDTVVSPVFNNWLDAAVPAPALYNFLPAWLPVNNQVTQLATAQRAIITTIQALMGADQATTSTYNGQVNTTNQFVQNLPTIALQLLPTYVTQYTVDTTILQTILTASQATRTAAMTPAIAALTASFSAFNDTCTRVDDLWDKLDTTPVTGYDVTQPGVFYPPASATYYPFTPYYTLQSFLTNGTANPPKFPASPPVTPVAMPDFLQELGNATNNTAMQQALADITGSQAPLGQAGNNTVWPAPPSFGDKKNSDGSPYTYTAQDVIDQM